MNELTNNYLYVDNILYNTLGFSAEAFQDLRCKAQALLVFQGFQLIRSELYVDDETVVEDALAQFRAGKAIYLQQDIVIYHANCSDGLSAAAVAKMAMPNAILIPGTYGFPKFNFQDCYIYFVDFSYKKDDMKILLEKNQNVVLIDHHKSAIEETEDLLFEHANFSRFIAFNNEKSGVGLACEYWRYGQEVPYAYQLIQDRDLWTWELNGKNILKVIDTFYPRTVESYIELGKLSKEEVLALEPRGQDLVALEDNLEEQMIKDSTTYINIFEYTDIPCLNVHGSFVSNIGNKIMTKYPETPFVLLWQVTKKGIKISIRSTDENEDASQIAQRFAPNGGGHHNAAGVLLDMNSPHVQTLLGIVNE